MKSKQKIYIDIDGVLITAKETRPADHVAEFIGFITESFNCYWLTTHCKGESKAAINYLKRYLDKNLIEKLAVVQPKNWDTSKTEAIDFSSDFFWLDDCPLQFERKILEQKDCLDRLILVDLNKPDELLNILERLKLSL